MEDAIKLIGTIAAVILPLWNIPLIVRIRRRKSSRDVSLWWAAGIWVCFMLMLPSGLTSADAVFKLFSILNILMFSLVLFFVLKYYK